jgi:hypothetical protein
VVLKALARDPGQRFTSAIEFRAALLAAPTSDDPTMAGATGIVPAAPPPARPRPATPTPTFAQSERRWLIPTLLIVVIATALGLAGLLFGQTEVGHDLLDRTLGNDDEQVDTEDPGGDSGDGGDPVRLVGVAAFDPLGTAGEHDGEAGEAVDGDPATDWTTEDYNARNLSGKAGVGLLVEVEGGLANRTLNVRSSTQGWNAEIFVGDDPGAWQAPGPTGPVATIADARGDASVPLGDASGRYVLVWITLLGEAGPPFGAAINEIVID